MRLAPPALLALPLLLCACVSQAKEAPAPPPNAAGGADQGPSARADEGPATLERPGVFVPVEFTAVSLWPEAYSGETLVLEVLPHGTIVEEGEVLVRLDTRTIEQQIRDQELDVSSSTLRHEGKVQKNTLADESAAAALAQAKAQLERAQRALEGYKSHELAFSKRQTEQQAKREQSFVDDQVDELEQLEAMYEADELVDATEEIVLKRSRRDLDSTRARNALSADRRSYEEEYSRPMQVASREEDVHMLELSFARLTRTQEIDARERGDAALRSAKDLEKKVEKLEKLRRDAQLMTIRAPRAGVFLHGKIANYRPGSNVPRLERGGRLSTRADVLLVADAEHLGVQLDVPEKDLGRVRAGAKARVSAPARPGIELSGRLELDTYPAARGGGVFDARVELEGAQPGVVFGMAAQVEVECEGKVEG